MWGADTGRCVSGAGVQAVRCSGAPTPTPHPPPQTPQPTPHTPRLRTPAPRNPAPPAPLSTTFSVTFHANVMLNVVLIGCGMGGAVVGCYTLPTPTPPLTPPPHHPTPPPPPPLAPLTPTLTLHPAHPPQSPQRCTLRVCVRQKPYVSLLLKLGN